MRQQKYDNIKRAAYCGKYPDTFRECLSSIPLEIQNALPWNELARLVDVIHQSYEAGHTAGWKEAK